MHGYLPVSVTGLIPAHAGKTGERAESGCGQRAHPRSRGENEAGDEKGSTFDGSSPLTRGKRLPAFARFVRPGLIPAHAGKTDALPGCTNGWEGSSPLTRGKPGHPPPRVGA